MSNDSDGEAAGGEAEQPEITVVDGTTVLAEAADQARAAGELPVLEVADDADEVDDDDTRSGGGRGITGLLAALGLLVLGGGGATAVGVKVLRDRD